MFSNNEIILLLFWLFQEWNCFGFIILKYFTIVINMQINEISRNIVESNASQQLKWLLFFVFWLFKKKWNFLIETKLLLENHLWNCQAKKNTYLSMIFSKHEKVKTWKIDRTMANDLFNFHVSFFSLIHAVPLASSLQPFVLSFFMFVVFVFHCHIHVLLSS